MPLTIVNKSKMIAEIMKFSFHHRAFYCYVGMSIWICFLITAMVDSDTWLLQGVLVVTRHGDRGPLTHLHGGDKLPCDTPPPSPLLKTYEEWVSNTSSAGRAWWVAGPGPFHNFPALPPRAATRCALGQLTPQGLLQMLTVGNILKEAYGEKLGLENSDPTGKRDTGDVIMYSTRYRRTFQSLAGLAWGLAGSNAGARLAKARESHSVAFCFRECACAAHHALNKKISIQAKHRLDNHPALKELVTKLSTVLFESQEHPDPDVVRDGALAHMCHDTTLPCVRRPEKQKISLKKLRQDTVPGKKLLEYEVSMDKKYESDTSNENGSSESLNRDSRLEKDKPNVKRHKMVNDDILLQRNLQEATNNNNIESDKMKQQTKKNTSETNIFEDHNVLDKDDTLEQHKHNVKGREVIRKDLSEKYLLDIENDNDKNPLKNQKETVPKRNLLDIDIDTLNMELDYINNQLDFNNEIGRKARDIIGKYYDTKDKQKAPLDFDAQMEREKLLYYQQRYMDNADAYDDVVIVKKNLDADFNFPNDARMDTDFDEEYKEPTPEITEEFCIRKDHITSLFAYLEWSYRQEIKNIHNRKRGLLLAYGLMHNIVQNMIKMISENKPKIVIYSGHDKTLQPLILALGLTNYQHYNVNYASRMIFEVYRKKDLRDEFKFTKRKAVAQDFYFRVVYNGEDVTNKLSFCKNKQSIVMKVADPIDDMKTYNTYLCPIENVVRFIHDDYFAIFNVTNFKDACATYGNLKRV
ncbi:2-phosphoxylose phosphatase 1 isoform X2 [Leguminivora glycinivorella]|uniref:2-phosphoxylose phosphatase 1 isoform X2 n=1 Tax=Leguminivora glycinivorella TaxID=1035111 RepID=UPI0020104739|nr:2-phosphoxylose phosphatase 1 isoform X2 [Leguminivora glycinivorella]